MFKGKILQFSDTEAIVLSDTLNYEKIKLKPQMEIGQNIFYFEEDLVIESKTSVIPSILDRLSSIKFAYVLAPVIAVLLVAVMFFSNDDLTTPLQINTYGVISIDINPSVSLLVSKDGIIEHAEGKNEDGSDLLSSLSLVGDTIHTAIGKIIEASEKSGYLAQDNQIFIATTEQSSEQHINGLVESALENLESDDSYTVYVADVDYKVYEESEIEKVSLGHYYIDSKTDVSEENLFSPETIEQITSEGNKPLIKERKPKVDKVEEKPEHKDIIQDKKEDKAQEKIEHKDTAQDKQEDKVEDKLEHKDIIQDKKEDKTEEQFEHKDAIQDKKEDKAQEKIEHKDTAQDKQENKAQEKIEHKDTTQDKQDAKTKDNNKKETDKNNNSKDKK